MRRDSQQTQTDLRLSHDSRTTVCVCCTIIQWIHYYTFDADKLTTDANDFKTVARQSCDYLATLSQPPDPITDWPCVWELPSCDVTLLGVT